MQGMSWFFLLHGLAKHPKQKKQHQGPEAPETLCLDLQIIRVIQSIAVKYIYILLFLTNSRIYSETKALKLRLVT